MKKIFSLFLVGAILTGCSEIAEGEQGVTTPTETIEVTGKSSETTSSTDVEEMYAELTIQDHFNPAEYETHLITDNPGTRVFIFHADIKPVYKTVFIKPESRLKVIDIENHQLLMNEKI